MKKLLLALVAVISAMSMSATDLYLRGDINNWGTTNKMTESNGTYTITIEKLYGAFKVADGNWTEGMVWGSNGSAVKLDTPYTTLKSNSSTNLTIDGGATLSNVTVTFVESTGVLTITGKSQANTYEKLYIIGQINSQGWEGDRTDMPLEKVSEGVYSGTYTITTSSNYFKLQAGTWTYGPATDASGDINLGVGDKATIYYPCGDKAYTIPAGEYTFVATVDKDAATGTLEIKGKAVYPDNMYLVGDYELNGTEVHWNPSNAILLSSTTDGIYSSDVKMIYGADMAPAAYFSFISKQGEWANVGNRFGAKEKDTAIKEGDTADVIAGENSFAIAPGNYNISLNLATMKVTISPATGVEATIGEEEMVNVYNVNGVMVRKAVNAAQATDELPAGLYIVGGKKVLVNK